MKSQGSLRSRSLVRVQANISLDPNLEIILARYSKHISDGGIARERRFLQWLVRSGEAVTAAYYRRALDSQRLELAGDLRLLAMVGEVEKGRVDLTFSVGDGRAFVGAGEIAPRALPYYALEGTKLLLTVSRPKCRSCGCTDERECAQGCIWATPDHCSRCYKPSGRRKR